VPASSARVAHAPQRRGPEIPALCTLRRVPGKDDHDRLQGGLGLALWTTVGVRRSTATHPASDEYVSVNRSTAPTLLSPHADYFQAGHRQRAYQTAYQSVRSGPISHVLRRTLNTLRSASMSARPLNGTEEVRGSNPPRLALRGVARIGGRTGVARRRGSGWHGSSRAAM
jgi:hypothetical protein